MDDLPSLAASALRAASELWHEHHPFTNVVAIAGALVTLFVGTSIKMLGRLSRWANLGGDTPAFIVSVGPKGLAIAVMAWVWTMVGHDNYQFSILGAIVCGIGLLICVPYFEYLRRAYVVSVPEVGPDGQQLRSLFGLGKLRFRNVVIGTVDGMQADAKKKFDEARVKNGGLSLARFLRGVGGAELGNPAALWDQQQLARLSTRLSFVLMLIVLFAALALFLAAYSIDAASRTTGHI